MTFLSAIISILHFYLSRLTLTLFWTAAFFCIGLYYFIKVSGGYKNVAFDFILCAKGAPAIVGVW